MTEPVEVLGEFRYELDMVNSNGASIAGSLKFNQNGNQRAIACLGYVEKHKAELTLVLASKHDPERETRTIYKRVRKEHEQPGEGSTKIISYSLTEGMI